MIRKGSASIEIGRDGVRGVSLAGSRRQPRLTGWAEQRVEHPRDLESALRAVADKLDPAAPIRLLLGADDARITRVELPKHFAGDPRRAIAEQAFQNAPGDAESYLLGVRAEGLRLGLRQCFTVLLVRREPVETWCGLLGAMGRTVRELASPGAIALCEPSAREGSTLWVDLTGARTALALFRDGRLLEERCLDKGIPSADEPIATVEARLQDVRAIDQMLRSSGGDGRAPAVDRLVVCGAPTIAEPLFHQLREPYEKLGLRLDLCDPWRGVSLGRSPPPPQTLVRLAGCVRLARSPRLPLAAVPRRVARSRRADRAWAAAAAAGLLLLLGSTGWMVSVEQHRDRRLAARERTRAALDAARRASTLPVPDPLYSQTPDWSPVLVDIGHLAQPGVDYTKLVLAAEDDSRARLGLVGTASQGSSMDRPELLEALHERLLTSPYRAGLPRLAAASGGRDPSSRRLRFALEEEMKPTEPATEEGR